MSKVQSLRLFSRNDPECAWLDFNSMFWMAYIIITYFFSEKLATFKLLSCKRWHQLNPPSDPGRHWLTFCEPTHPRCKHSLWMTPYFNFWSKWKMVFFNTLQSWKNVSKIGAAQVGWAKSQTISYFSFFSKEKLLIENDIFNFIKSPIKFQKLLMT